MVGHSPLHGVVDGSLAVQPGGTPKPPPSRHPKAVRLLGRSEEAQNLRLD